MKIDYCSAFVSLYRRLSWPGDAAKSFAFSVLCLLIMTSVAVPKALAAPLLCRTVANHQVCVLSIKRSAKNFWDYRVQLQVDGKPHPQERYNCRSSTPSSRAEISPSPSALREFVCGLIYK